MAASAQHSSSIGSTVSSLLDSVGTFFSQLAGLSWFSLLLGLALYAVYLLLRSRALFNALRAAYPGERIRWRDVWGAYMVGYAINNVFPLGGGNLAQLFLTRLAIPRSSYPAVASALWTGTIFDWFMGLLVMCFAFTQGVFPKPPDFSKLPAFDISFFASNMRFTLFLLTVLGIGLPGRVRAPVGAGQGVLAAGAAGTHDPARLSALPPGDGQLAVRELGRRGSRPTGRCSTRSTSAGRCETRCSCSASRWWRRCSRSRREAPASSRRCCVTIFAGSGYVASFSVGQQIATAALTTACGFAALVLIFRFRSFREVMERGKADRRAASDSDGPVERTDDVPVRLSSLDGCYGRRGRVELRGFSHFVSGGAVSTSSRSTSGRPADRIAVSSLTRSSRGVRHALFGRFTGAVGRVEDSACPSPSTACSIAPHAVGRFRGGSPSASDSNRGCGLVGDRVRFVDGSEER